MGSPITDAHRGGSGPPLVLLHGITSTWRIWQPVLRGLEQHHTVFAPSLPGHLGAAPLDEGFAVSIPAVADLLEAQLDREGIQRAHLVGNSLGGWLALELAGRGRALSVVALSPAGAWDRPRDQVSLIRAFRVAAFLLERAGSPLKGLMRRPRSRRLALRNVMEHGERVPAAIAAEQLDEAIQCLVLTDFLDWVSGEQSFATLPGPLDVPVRIAWAEHDRTIPFARYGRPYVTAVPGSELVMLAGVGHVPMYDDPQLVTSTILDITRQEPKAVSQTAPETLDGRLGKIALTRWSAEPPTFAVLLAHGYAEHAGRYEHVARRLVEAGAAVLAPDHAAHGRSDGELGTFGTLQPMVDDLDAARRLLASEHPGLPLVLIGHSMGGLLATLLVQRDPSPFAAVVLSGPVVGGNPQFEALLGMDPMPDVPLDPAILSRDPAVGMAYVEDPLVYSGPLQRSSVQALFDAVAQVADGPGFGELPVLWIHGEQDQLAPYEASAAAFEHLRGPGTEEKVYAGAQHEIFNETNQDEVLGDTVAFIAKHV